MIETPLHSDALNIDALLNETLLYATNYLNRLDEHPVSAENGQIENINLNVTGIGASEALQYFKTHFEKHIVASSGPRYWGFVTGGVTPAALVGDWLTPIFDQNTQNTVGNGDVSARIEEHTIHLMLQLFNLPTDIFLGGFVTGATMSNFTGLAVARQWAGKELGVDIARAGVIKNMKILATTPHSSALKCLSMLGIGSKNAVAVKVLEGNREAMDVKHLEQILKKTKKPCILISSGGTVNTVDFDDMRAIADLKSRYNFWWHVDAAFGGFAALSENHKYLLDGWELADSITIDCHKWLNTPYDSAVIFIRKAHRTLQTQTFQNTNAPYLGAATENINYLNLLPENSRRFRALPAWFSITAYGRSGYSEIVTRCIELAQLFAEMLNNSGLYNIVAPVRLNVVCFAIKNKEADEAARNTLTASLRKQNRFFVTPTFYNGFHCLRAAFVNWKTQQKDIEIAIEILRKAQ